MIEFRSRQTFHENILHIYTTNLDVMRAKHLIFSFSNPNMGIFESWVAGDWRIAAFLDCQNF